MTYIVDLLHTVILIFFFCGLCNGCVSIVLMKLLMTRGDTSNTWVHQYCKATLTCLVDLLHTVISLIFIFFFSGLCNSCVSIVLLQLVMTRGDTSNTWVHQYCKATLSCLVDLLHTVISSIFIFFFSGLCNRRVSVVLLKLLMTRADTSGTWLTNNPKYKFYWTEKFQR